MIIKQLPLYFKKELRTFNCQEYLGLSEYDHINQMITSLVIGQVASTILKKALTIRNIRDLRNYKECLGLSENDHINQKIPLLLITNSLKNAILK